ncbi:MAG: hypothetical protein ACLSA6_15240 [Holdemania massiliensis]
MDKAEGEWIAFRQRRLGGSDYYAQMAEVMKQGADVVVSDIEYFMKTDSRPGSCRD